MHHFSGSYPKDDVNFLVKVIDVAETSLREKEMAIQTGKAHYSEMISKEYLPSEEYLELFERLTELNGKQMAQAIYTLASHINNTNEGEITLVSLLRAGTPVGVLLKRTLETYFNRDVKHYSVSIVRDRGIDTNALNYILDVEKRSPSGFVFVDGWTAKGVITRELKHYVAELNKTIYTPINDTLVVLSDIGGTADVTANFDDYAIPSGILNSTVSGLVSRSIWNDQIGDNDFHGVVYYEEFTKNDKTVFFIEKIMTYMVHAVAQKAITKSDKSENQNELLMDFAAFLLAENNESDINMIKPGVAEATRVMLRRIPKVLYVKDADMPDVAHLIQLAKDKSIPIVEDRTIPVNAAAVISNLRKD